MTFGDMQNFVLTRLRQRGISWGQPPTNLGTDLSPPYEVMLALNTAYNDFLRATLDARLATLDVDFTTVAGATSYALAPCPVGPPTSHDGGLRPAIMQVYECRYVNGSGTTTSPYTIERYIPTIASLSFRRITGGYMQRYGALAPYPDAVSQQYGRRTLSVFPGTAVGGDTIRLFCCPDPQGTAATVGVGGLSCASGNIMVGSGDVPIIPPQFHMALVYLATAILCEQADKQTGSEMNRSLYAQKVDEALEFGAVTGEGATEQSVLDPYADFC